MSSLSNHEGYVAHQLWNGVLNNYVDIYLIMLCNLKTKIIFINNCRILAS